MPDDERVIGILVYDGALLLNVSGPSEVFFMATRERGRAGGTGGYRVVLLSRDGGLVRTSCGIELNTRGLPEPGELALDTVATVGGMTVRALARDERTIDWLRGAAASATRIASFGGGVFLLAGAGLLDGRRCAAHWRIAEALRRRHPTIRVEPDEIFVRDGNRLTAAGSSASLDLALQMVEDDFGKRLATRVAEVLVVPRMRSGDQPQRSVELRAQVATLPRVSAAAEWIVANIARKPSVAALAERFAMSERNFSRVFSREMGLSPRLFLEQARLEAARRWLAGSDLPIDGIARRTGFASGEHLAHAFRKRMQMTPSAYRARAHDGEA